MDMSFLKGFNKDKDLNLPKIYLVEDLKDENGEPFFFMDNYRYLINCKDDSMNDDLMDEGDTAIVEYVGKARSGDIVVYNDPTYGIIIRVLYLNKETNKYYLKASNVTKNEDGTYKYPIINLDGDVEIYGVVTKVMKDFKPVQ